MYLLTVIYMKSFLIFFNTFINLLQSVNKECSVICVNIARVACSCVSKKTVLLFQKL